MRRQLSFFTNIPSPYNLDLFEALSNYFDLKVIYYAELENDRQWNLDTESKKYGSTVLKTNVLGKLIQKIKPQFHFSNGILKECLNDNSEFVILGGNYFSPNTYLVLFLSLLRKKTIFWFGEKILPTELFVLKTIKRILLFPLFYSCKSIFCIGESAILSYKFYGFKGECFNIPYSINSSKFKKKNVEASQLNSLLNSYNPDNKFVILTSGSLIKRKGIDIAIKSYLKLPPDLKGKSQLWIIGDGPLLKELEKLDDKSGEINFLGFIKPIDLPYYFNCANLFVFPSRYDGWAVVINEALSAGLPIVVSSEVTASELIKNETNGYVCETEAIESYTKAIEKLLTDEKLRARIIENNVIISEKIDSEMIANEMFRIISNV